MGAGPDRVGVVSQGPRELALIGSRGLWALAPFMSGLGHGAHMSLDATDSFLALCGMNSTIFQIRILKCSRDWNLPFIL